MTDIQSKINHLFNILKSLLEQITPLRQQVETLEKELTYVQREYDRIVGPFNAEADRLEILRSSLRARLEQPRSHTPSPIPSTLQQEKPQPPQTLMDTANSNSLSSPSPSPLPEDPRSRRKRSLADHIDYFVATDDRETVMQVINAVLADDHRDIGDMLELLSWGDIWTARPDWETPEEQYVRLQNWESTLKERLEYWQNRFQQLKDEPRQGLLQEMKSRKPEEWSVYLDELARKQEEYNKKLSQEVDFLEKELAKQSENED
ncbi:MAG: hypothetical protein JSV88_26570 [Candidatus Aminicenantes bacterium]|nr:MAG: hypothetical protein JSV88_26570 [Candidatus Aminicenantes bacterium]